MKDTLNTSNIKTDMKASMKSGMKKNPMYREIQHHPVDYVLLLIGLLILTITYLLFQDFRYAQWAVGVAVGLGYITWGIVHHYRSHILTKHIIKEYVFAGLLASVILILLAL